MRESVGGKAIANAVEAAEGPAICAYVTADYPTHEAFIATLRSVAAAADVVEVGVPFTDPMADGLTIQQASLDALDQGVTLAGIIETLTDMRDELSAPILLMGYYNPFLAFGLDGLGAALVAAGVSGLIVPDLPDEEAGPMRDALAPHGLALVQLVTPSTPQERLERLAAAGGGFTYAVTVKGVTGGQVGLGEEDLEYLDRVREASDLPVLAGFGIRTAEDVERLTARVDGVVVGSALIQAIDRGDDAGEFVDSLRPRAVTA